MGKCFCRSVALQGHHIWVATTKHPKESPDGTMHHLHPQLMLTPQAETGEVKPEDLPFPPPTFYPPWLFFNFPWQKGKGFATASSPSVLTAPSTNFHDLRWGGPSRSPSPSPSQPCGGQDQPPPRHPPSCKDGEGNTQEQVAPSRCPQVTALSPEDAHPFKFSSEHRNQDFTASRSGCSGAAEPSFN